MQAAQDHAVECARLMATYEAERDVERRRYEEVAKDANEVYGIVFGMLNPDGGELDVAGALNELQQAAKRMAGLEAQPVQAREVGASRSARGHDRDVRSPCHRGGARDVYDRALAAVKAAAVS